MSSITYENDQTDITAYGRLIYDKSPTVKHHRAKALRFAVLLIVIFGVIIYFVDSNRSTLYIWIVLSIAWLIYIPIQHKKRYLKNMLSEFDDEKHRRLFGKHTLTIDDFGLTDEIEYGINKTNWDRIEHIESVETHSFVFVDSAMAYAIPKERIIDGEYESFIQEMRTNITSNT